MADLRIDWVELETLRGDLSSIADQIEIGVRRREDMEQWWGGKQMRRAMQGFDDDWDRHRSDLVRFLRELSNKCEGLVKAFSDLDAGISAQAFGHHDKNGSA